MLGRKRIFGDANGRRSDIRNLASSGQLAGVRLLLVEDNDINREFACELLRSEGIEVDEAINGEEALQRVQQRDYDAVLMDIQMPVMDGHEAARRIRALAEHPAGTRFANLPIIAMTALAMAQDAEQSRAAGMNDHVTKPIAPDRLMSTLAKWVKSPNWRGGKRSTVSSSTTLQAGDLPPDLQTLTQLDVIEGVRRIGGKADAYRKQLRRFREHYSDAVGELRRLARDEGTRSAEEFCHALKGVTGNLGAQALYECVTAIDNALKQDNPPAEDLLTQTESLLQQLIAEIDGLPAAEAPPAATGTAIPPDTLHALLTQLAHAIEYDLGAAEDLLHALQSGLAGKPQAADLTALAASIDAFEIETAQRQLKQIQDSLPETTP